VETALRADFANAGAMASLVQIIAPHSKPKEVIEELRTRFLDECDYSREADWQERFATAFAGDEIIVVPRVFRSHSAVTVLTTQFQEGRSLGEFLASSPSAEARNRFGEALFRVYFGALYQHGLLNCDPHPGNYIFRPDGKLAILDYGCARSFTTDYRNKLRRLVKAATTAPPDEIEVLAAAADLDILDAGADVDRSAALALWLKFYEPVLKDGPYKFEKSYSREVLRLMVASKRNLTKMRIPPDLVFLNRITWGLFSVLAELEATFNAQRVFLNLF
jgi:predicted unusual protein kinase regulating ubiquinone biosynthesis (AarF/ABC1/UbiB family)